MKFNPIFSRKNSKIEMKQKKVHQVVKMTLIAFDVHEHSPSFVSSF